MANSVQYEPIDADAGYPNTVSYQPVEQNFDPSPFFFVRLLNHKIGVIALAIPVLGHLLSYGLKNQLTELEKTVFTIQHAELVLKSKTKLNQLSALRNTISAIILIGCGIFFPNALGTIIDRLSMSISKETFLGLFLGGAAFLDYQNSLVTSACAMR